ncbi:MAG: RidA family protein [Candidatus Aerophobetes bacterium]|nr:RidA family protein [Candidatus Aerophobetes bacterium]
MAEKEIITTEKTASAVGPYSQAMKIGDLIFTSGQLGISPSTGKMVEGGIESETRQALENLKAILEAGGSSLDEVVKTAVFITDMNDFAKVNKIYSEYFTGGFPARSCVEVGALAKGAQIEIEAIATSK